MGMSFRDLLKALVAAPRPQARHCDNPEDSSEPLSESRKRRDFEWLPAGARTKIAGRSVHGGLFYFGRSSPSVHRPWVSEPSLVDPSLPVDWSSSAKGSVDLGYWPSYDDLSDSERASYLTWLNSDRSDPETPIGYIFLYFYGIERHLLFDMKVDPKHPDWDILTAELLRLLSIYAANESFNDYSTRLLELMEIVDSGGASLPIPRASTWERHWQMPLWLRVRVGAILKEERPLPAELGLALVRTAADETLRTPAARCRLEFDALFKSRYRARFGEGLIIKKPKRTIRVEYRAASAGISRNMSIKTDLPDINTIGGPKGKLEQLAAECSSALDSYSRFLGKHPDEAAKPRALALLPGELMEAFGGPLIGSVRIWLTGALGEEPYKFVSLEDVTTVLLQNAGPLSRADAATLASFLGKFGVGIEPDVRFDGPCPEANGPVVLFRTTMSDSASPSSAYATAAVLTHLCAVVAYADGEVTEHERAHLTEHIERVLQLDELERSRLEAHVAWLLASRAGLKGMKRRIQELSQEARTAAGKCLIAIAAIDGSVSPAEITTITKLYALLGLNESDVYSMIHGLGSHDEPAYIVTGASDDQPRWLIPSPRLGKPGRLELDEAKIQAKLADTAAVTAMLAGIFRDDDQLRTIEHTSPSEAVMEGGASNVLGLDRAHGSFVEELMLRRTWSRNEAEALASTFGILFLDGALDRINEASLNACGEPLLDGTDALELNSFAIGAIAR